MRKSFYLKVCLKMEKKDFTLKYLNIIKSHNYGKMIIIIILKQEISISKE